MKTLIANYTFDASAQQITFTDYNPIVLERILLVTNTTDNIIIYNFADSTKGGAVATNVLTLAYDTTSMDDTDDLQIFYEVLPSVGTSSTVASSATNVTLLSAKASRIGATIHNDSTAVLYVKLGATASATSFTVKMDAGDYFETPYGYTGIIDGIWSSATGNARITEIA